jgi:hypothetical protein
MKMLDCMNIIYRNHYSLFAGATVLSWENGGKEVLFLRYSILKEG